MIKLFTVKLPLQLRKEVYFEYQRKHNELSKIIKSTDRFHNFKYMQESIELILACAVFYNRVVRPLESARRCILKIAKRGVASIQMGSYSLSQNEAEQMNIIVNSYRGIMQNFGLKFSDLDTNDMYYFVQSLHERMLRELSRE